MAVLKTSVLVLDSTDPEPLARFYAALLGATVQPAGDDHDLLLVSGHAGVVLGIRRDLGQAPPSWPRPEDSQQAHLQIFVAPDALDEAEREVVSLGARPIAAEREGTRSDRRTDVRRYTDPGGHAFVLATMPPAGSGLPLQRS
ncbi:VOC family protein [Streptomyces sp. NPDC006553]|uniref:VOC family protein n=1 Tax=unclassified Streptomyces TaxID=2593676 RepID=UPI002252A8A2|nr:VOC family protein [Streptomyces sp. NBC_00233]MCX5231390.1 VOC family protein [Streptomyces sp. NBC_00233]